ncbi:MAG: TRAP transporter small permease [Rhodospirillaceae bacterium]|nr:TRAP transporter small permease [Rhodospirillaceae bacterium]MYF85854.1 TRAP transporter small permease [Rhodospirillaceae bacterium]MYH35183.1 TRAP transporter small permease [Rhodospirillaceae bacterium]MYK15314.1 TRAP transporter small permease [Rhodospirillaceae bacterium]MYK57428.1 TRAP transporter small permease [Rhodospirillaceae bacterium]
MTRTPRLLLAGMAALAGVAIVGLMTLTVLDIAGRNLKLFYLVGVIEISTLTMVLMAYFAFSHTFVKDGHISVDLFTTRLSGRTNARLDAVWLIVAGLFFAVLAWPVLGHGLELHEAGERTTNMEWSHLVFAVPSFAGIVVTAATCIVLGAIRVIRTTRN